MTRAQREIWRQPIQKLQDLVCEEFGVKVIDLRSSRTDKGIIPARHIAMWLCRHYTGASLPVIGANFGGRDHTSVMYAVKNADALMARTWGLPEKVNTIIKKIEAEQ